MQNKDLNNNQKVKKVVKTSKKIYPSDYDRKSKSLEGLSNKFLVYFIDQKPSAKILLDSLTKELGFFFILFIY